MDLERFAARFHQAADRAREAAKDYLIESLPPKLMFRVRLNQSYDESSPPIYDRFPEDSLPERARQLHFCDERVALEAMWRDGKVPQWADLSVIGEQYGATLIEVLVCGRFTSDESTLYHAREGIPPFHSVEPTLPPSWERGTRFSVHMREECWDLQDAIRLTAYSESVWSLAVHTDELDPDYLAGLPDLPRMEILEHDQCALGSRTFQAFSRFPSLRVVRVWLAEGSQFAIGEGAVCPLLTDLEIHGLADLGSSLGHLQAAAPALRSLTLEGSGQLSAAGAAPEGLERLTVRAEEPPEGMHLPEQLQSVCLTMPFATEEGVVRLLGGIRSIESLSVRGTPVGDQFVEQVVRRWSLAYLDLVRTKVSDAKVRELSERYPDLKMLPNLKPQAPERSASR